MLEFSQLAAVCRPRILKKKFFEKFFFKGFNMTLILVIVYILGMFWQVLRSRAEPRPVFFVFSTASSRAIPNDNANGNEFVKMLFLQIHYHLYCHRGSRLYRLSAVIRLTMNLFTLEPIMRQCHYILLSNILNHLESLYLYYILHKIDCTNSNFPPNI